MTSRSERREIARRYRGYSIQSTCGTCGATLGLTMAIERGEPDPAVTFLHKLDGSHEPVISGNSDAARARREGHVIGQDTRRMDA